MEKEKTVKKEEEYQKGHESSVQPIGLDAL